MTIYERLEKARAAFKPIHRTAEVARGNFSYRYAPLDEVMSAITPALHEAGLAITQTVVSLDGHLMLLTRLYAPAEGLEPCLTSTVPLGLDGQGMSPQAVGAAITYARRYGLSVLLGLVAEDDDDAQSAEEGIVYGPPEDEVPLTPDAPRCAQCNRPMQRRSGTTADGKAWAGWFCPVKGHPVRWI